MAMRTVKKQRTRKGRTVYVGVLASHLDQIIRQLEVVRDAARELGGQKSKALGGSPIAFDPGNILIDGRCMPVPPDRKRTVGARARNRGLR